jgi:peptide-methionine (S)-S-oxide reductase
MTIRRLLAICATAFLILSAGVPGRAASAPHLEKAVLAGGCFWGMEGVFESLGGVTQVVSGFSGGAASSAHYDQVSTGTTGHAESVEITYDPARISYHQLLEVFFTAHDPTTVDRQGPDEGSQYRSAIFYANDEQKREAQTEITVLTRAHAFNAPIVTQIVPLHGFYAAEAYHQHYMAQHPYEPYIVINDKPKLAAVRAKFPQLVQVAGR